MKSLSSAMPARRVTAWTALLGTLLAGCAAAPQPEQPVAQLPTHYAAASGHHAPEQLAQPVLHWDDLFPDAELRRLQQAALAYNSDLRVSVMRVEEARAAAGLQRASSLPAIGIGMQGVRARTELPLDQINLSGLPLPVAVPLGNVLTSADRDVVVSTYQAGVVLTTYEIDFWGKVRSLNQAARDRYLASAEAQQAFRTGLLALVTDTWLQGLELQERLALAKHTLRNNEESHRIMQRRVEVGLISDMELRQTETLVVGTRSDIAALERQYAQNRALMTQLTHISDPPRASASQPLTRLPDRFLSAGLPSALLTQRPDIRAAELQLQAARANVKAARAAFLPSITLTAAGGVASSALENLFSHNYSAWAFVPQISLPIFDGGRRQANLDLAEVRKHTAVAQYESSIQNAFREVSELLAAHHWLAEQEHSVRQLVAAQQDRTRLAQKRYARGYSSHFEVLDAERGRFAAEQSLVQVHRARLSSLVGLYKALGGDATQPLAPANVAGAAGLAPDLPPRTDTAPPAGAQP